MIITKWLIEHSPLRNMPQDLFVIEPLVFALGAGFPLIVGRPLGEISAWNQSIANWSKANLVSLAHHETE